MKIIGTIEVRMGSTRLPEKTMQPVFENIILLEAVYLRFKRVKSLSRVIVATSINPKDDVSLIGVIRMMLNIIEVKKTMCWNEL